MLDKYATTLLMLTLLLLPAGPSMAGETHLWSHGYLGDGYDALYGVAVDSAGNIVVTGYSEGGIDFGGGPLASAGSFDIFVAKFDASGTHIWSKLIGGADGEYGTAVAIDGSGNIFLLAIIFGTTDFGGGPLSSAGGEDIAIAKLDSNGNHLWSFRVGDTGVDHAFALALDSSGNVVVSGRFDDTVDFGGGSLVSAGNGDIFVACYDPSGSHLWSQRYGDSDREESAGVATDAENNVFVTGRFYGSIDFGGGILQSAGTRDVFLAKLDSLGNHVWSQSFGDTLDQASAGVAVDNAGNVVITGDLNGSADFGGGTITSAGDSDVFVAGFDGSGNPIWSARYGDAGTQTAYDVAVKSSGNVVVVGSHRGSIDFGGGDLTSAGDTDLYAAEFSPLGAHVWSQGFGDSLYQRATRCTVDGAGAVLVSGDFTGTIDLGGGPLTSTSLLDTYLAKFSPTAVGIPSSSRPYASHMHVYPNPFNPTVTIDYYLPSGGDATVSVYDVSGRLVSVIEQGALPSGWHSTVWNAGHAQTAVSSGVYFVRVKAVGYLETRKIVLLK